MGIFGKSKKDQANDLMNEGMTALNKFDYQWANYKFSEVLKLDPKNRTALLYKARTLGNIGKYEEADLYFIKAIQIKPDSETWLEKGKVLSCNPGYAEEALNSFNKAFELNPADINITTSICDYYAKKGKYNEMRDTIDRYLTNYPNNASAWYTKGLLLERAGKTDEAYLCYQKAESLGSLEAKERIDKIRWNEMRISEICRKLFLKESDIIEKYSIDFFEPYQNAVDDLNLHHDKNKNFLVTLIFSRTLENEHFPPITPDNYFGITHAILILFQNKLAIGGEYTYSIPLEDIISIMRMRDEFENENAFIIKFGKDMSQMFIFRVRKDYERFYATISEAIRKTRERNNVLEKNITIIDFSSIKEYLKNGGVVMQTFKCPGCGASLEFPDKIDTTTCQYCGNKIKAVDLFEKIRNLI